MTVAKRFYVETLGCPKNQVDSDKLIGTLLADGSSIDTGVLTPLKGHGGSLLGAIVKPLLFAFLALLLVVALKLLAVAVALVMYFAASFYHAALGMQVVIEDYVSGKAAKVATLMMSALAHVALTVAAVFALHAAPAARMFTAPVSPATLTM